MDTFSQLISMWPTKSAFAKDIGQDYGLVHQWDRRDSIPADYWETVVKAAQERKLKGVTLEALSKLRTKKKDN